MSHASSSSLPKHLSIGWCIAALVALIAAGFGGYGMWLYDSEHHGPADPLSVAYHTLQLFILHAPHMEHEVNWQLHIGRWLAAVVVFSVGIRGLYVLFRSELRLCWTWFRGGHVVICGLGRVGRQLVTAFRKRGDRVVVIESHSPDDVDGLPKGVVIVTGDACDASVLRRASVTRAKQLIAVCDGVQTNVAIVAKAGELFTHKYKGRRAKRKLESWLFVADEQLRQHFKREGLFPYTGNQFLVNVRGLHLFSLAARQVLNANPLDFKRIVAESSATAHLAIVGFGAMGQRLALQAAQVGHFANESNRKLKITVLEQWGSDRYSAFLTKYPGINDLVDFQHVAFSHTATDAAKQILQVAQTGSGDLVTVAICWDSQTDSTLGEDELFRRLEKDDAINLGLALELQQPGNESLPRTLLFLTRACGFGAMFDGEPGTDRSLSNVRVFGTVEETYSLDALVNETSDVIARILHEDWYEGEIASGKKQGDKPALWPWDQLGEMYRQSNRHAADHILVKLRAIGYSPGKLAPKKQRLTQIGGAQIELLAEMEHARWFAELTILGYAQDDKPRDDVARTHADFVPWDALNEETKDRDRKQVIKIPEALEKAGLGIYRDSSLDG
ncbi:MAG: NAD-binding protein [Pirellulaceae bacterium]